MKCSEVKQKLYELTTTVYEFCMFIGEYNLEWGTKWDDYL